MLMVGKVFDTLFIRFLYNFLNLVAKRVDFLKFIFVVIHFLTSHNHPVPMLNQLFIGDSSHRHLDLGAVVKPSEGFNCLKNSLQQLVNSILI